MAIYSNGQVGWFSGMVTPAGPSYLLDTYTGAAAAYSLRKLRNAYAGSAIRVRRSSDNTTLDVGFDANGNLDTASMLSFVGSNNQALYSEEFDNVYWTKTNTTITTNQTTAPDGTMTADLLSETTAENFHNLRNTTNSTFTSGTSWNMSVYVKKGPGATAPDTFALAFNGGEILGINAPWVLFNISTGVVVTSGNVSNDANFGSSITDVGNGWFRCAMWGTVTTTQGRPSIGAVRFTNNSNTINNTYYIGKTTSNMYVWGYQFQKALNDTSVLTTQPYTKTTTTTTAGNGFISIWYDQSSTYDASQQASASQPQIVNAGSLITTNGKPTVKFDGSNDFLVTNDYPFITTNKIYVAHVSSIETTNVTSMVVGHYLQFNQSIYLVGYRSTGRSLVALRDLSTSYSYDFNTYNINTQYLYETQLDTLNSTSTLRVLNYRNNSLETMNTNANFNGSLPTFTQPLSIGADKVGTNFKFKGNIQEIVAYYNVDQSSNRTGISNDINTYYTIY